MAHPPGDGAGGKSVSAPPRPGKPGVRRHRTGDGPVVPSGGALRDRGRRLPRPGAGVSSRLALIDRLAELLRPTPEGLLPRVVYRETGDLGLTAVQGGAGLALRFPRFTGRYRDDKAPTDATTVQEVLGLYRSARPTPAGS